MDIITHYGEARNLNATEAEIEIFEFIKMILNKSECPLDSLRLVRKSDSYVSAVMESSGNYGLMDLARFKYTDRAKWIKVCPSFDKIPLLSVEDVGKCSDLLIAGYRFNEPYL